MKTLRRDSAPVRMAMYLTWLLVLVLSAVFVVTFTGIAFSTPMMPSGAKETLRGEVIAVDNGMAIGNVTLESSHLGKYPNNDLNVFLNQTTSVNVCGREGTTNDIDVGRHAIVTYHEVGGVPLADSIAERC